MQTQAPGRLDETISVRLSTREKERLVAIALRQDRTTAAVARRILNAALDTEADGPRDGREA